MQYAEAKEYLYRDGSLRDVYVPSASPRELNAFMEYVRPMVSKGDFHMGGETASLPVSYAEVLERTGEFMAGLSIPVGSSVVNCHFFDPNELELDFRPSDYDDEANWDELSAFLQGLATSMDREVLVTAENMQACVYLRFQPTKTNTEQVSDGDA